MTDKTLLEQAAKRRELDSQIKALRKQLDTAKSNQFRAQQAKREANNVVIGYSQENVAENKRHLLDQARENLAAKTRLLEQAEQQVADLEKQLAKLEADRSQLDSWDIRMQAALDDYREARDAFQAADRKVRQLQEQVANLMPDIDRLRTAIATQESLVAKALNKTDLANARTGLAGYQAELADFEQLMANLNAQLPKSTKVLNDCRGRMENAERAVWSAKLDGLYEEFRQHKELVDSIFAVFTKAKTPLSAGSGLAVFAPVIGDSLPPAEHFKERQQAIAAEIGLLD
jgi:DNA repair exonuclease SbcCD ATPase subunit